MPFQKLKTLAAPALALALLLGTPMAVAEEPASRLHHDVTARLDPADHAVDAVDSVTIPAGHVSTGDGARFALHAGLRVTCLDRGFVLEGLAEEETEDAEEVGQRLRVQEYELRPVTGSWPDGPVTVRLKLSGKIHHPLVDEGEEYARSFARSPGIIGEEGVVLSGGSWWLPTFGDTLFTFRATLIVPEGWEAVSQGERTRHDLKAGRRIVTWTCPHPMEEIYVIAAPFTEYTRAAGDVEAQAFLRTPDPNMAAKYLEATAQYIEMYRGLIGPYPFAKFALIENFWETGYGMPSFTLLGPKIIRFPFILHSSYPHEILHNWWGNSVYVDWQSGNWCEGLTAYLADHLIREGQGRGTEYRRDSLKNYRNYVRGERDFPLTEFRSRHSPATAAVGYGKSLMLWHMLRIRMGDRAYRKALSTFYREQMFEVASWADVERIFSKVAGEDLAPMFEQWVTRTGAPELALRVVSSEGSKVQVEVSQTHAGDPYALTVSLAVTRVGLPDALVFPLEVTKHKQVFDVEVGAPAVRLDLDPEFDLFRRLDQAETPPTLSQVFGADRGTLILPAEGAPLAAEWRAFAESWAGGSETIEIVAEDALEALPADRAVWVLGADNRWKDTVLSGVAAHGVNVDADEIRFGAVSVPRAAHSFVYVARHPSDEQLALGWVGSDTAAALPGLARKLPHYGKYSYLAFEGEAPDNVAKGTWPANASPLVKFVGEGVETRPERGKLRTRKPLARLAPVFDPARLEAHVRYLADDAREGRGVGTKGLDESAEYIAKAFEEAGLAPGGSDGGWFDTWTEEGGPDGKPVTLRNVIGVIPGTDPSMAGQSAVLGAHYDHLGRGWPDVREAHVGEIHNGADDNASGVAVLIETAALLAKQLEPKRAVVFVAFSGEEWGLKGSRRYVATMEKWPAKKALGMVNLDTVGRLDGKKIMVLGSGTATEWRHVAMGVGFTTGVESTPISDDPGGSDQKSFHDVGVPAVQLFSGPHEDYHRPSDDVADVDFGGLVKVATWVRETMVYMSERPQPFTSTLGGAGPAGPKRPTAGRRVSLGTMPDFQFPGPGVKVASVIADSPAAQAGIQVGDIVLAIDGGNVTDLRAYSGLLKAHKPGDVIKIHLQRGDEAVVVEATLVAR